MTLKVGVLGTGMIGAEHVHTLATSVAGASVTRVFDVDTARAKEVANSVNATALGTAEAVIADEKVEALVIATPGPFHTSLVLTCIAAGKPVLCEKPLAPTIAECLSILEAEQASGRRLVQVGFMRRFDRGYVQVKAAIDQGRIGVPLVLHNIHRNPDVPAMFSNEMMMNDSMIHEFDVARWLLDDEIGTVQVFAPRSSPHAHAGLLDPQIAIFEMVSGALADVEIFASCRFGYDVRCEVVGSEGIAALETPRLSTVTTRGSRGEAIAEGWKARFGEAYRLELQAWVDATRTHTAIAPSAWDGYAATAVAEQAVEAQRTGKRAEVHLIDRPELYRERGTMLRHGSAGWS